MDNNEIFMNLQTDFGFKQINDLFEASEIGSVCLSRI